MPAPATAAPGLGAFIRDHRNAVGLSQTELANRLGVHQTTVSAWELGEHLDSVRKHVSRLSDILDVEAEVLQRLWWDALGGYLATAA